MIFHVIGIGRQTPIEIREALSIHPDDYKKINTLLSGVTGLKDLIIVSTCNRTELYFSSPFQIDQKSDVLSPLLTYFNVGKNTAAYFYFHSGTDAFRHLFCVTAALDSQVIGEPQITGQIKDGYRTADRSKSLSGFTKRVFEESFRIAKLVRKKTEIGKSAVSISYVVVKLAKKIFDTLAGKTLLVIGSGEMAELSIVNLLRHGAKKIYISNRTFERAVTLAEKYRASVVRFESLPDFIDGADLIVSSTGATEPILTYDMVKKTMARRKSGPLFLIDIAIPRDIDPKLNTLENVFLYNIDDLQLIIDENMGNREKESEKAFQLIESELNTFLKRQEFQKITPLVKALKSKFETYAANAVIRPLSVREDFSEKQKKTVNLYTHRLIGKLLHAHVEHIRSMFDEEKDPGKLLGDLFNLELQENTQKSTDGDVLYPVFPKKKQDRN